ncbi:hypothetical protein GF357_01575 [Candidatus Dojkabacteria bacterium]|nr:hypothetical protein [Candidatus Dojkabacteria bacterium]
MHEDGCAPHHGDTNSLAIMDQLPIPNYPMKEEEKESFYAEQRLLNQVLPIALQQPGAIHRLNPEQSVLTTDELARRVLINLSSSVIADATLYCYGFVDGKCHSHQDVFTYISDKYPDTFSSSKVVSNTIRTAIQSLILRYDDKADIPEADKALLSSRYFVSGCSEPRPQLSRRIYSRAKANLMYAKDRDFILTNEHEVLETIFGMYGPVSTELFTRYYRLGKYKSVFDKVSERRGLDLPETLEINNDLVTTNNLMEVDAIEVGRAIAEMTAGLEHGSRVWVNARGNPTTGFKRKGANFIRQLREYRSIIEDVQRMRDFKFSEEQLGVLMSALHYRLWGLTLKEGLEHYVERHEMETGYNTSVISKLRRQMREGDEDPSDKQVVDYFYRERLKRVFSEIASNAQLIDRAFEKIKDVLYAHYISDTSDAQIVFELPLSKFYVGSVRRLAVELLSDTGSNEWPKRSDLRLTNSLSSDQREYRIDERNRIGQVIEQLADDEKFTGTIVSIIGGISRGEYLEDIAAEISEQFPNKDINASEIGAVKNLFLLVYQDWLDEQ